MQYRHLDWLNSNQNNPADANKDLLTTHHKTVYNPEKKTFMAEQEELWDWEKACHINSVSSYSAFLKAHPNSPYTGSAHKRIMNLHIQSALDWHQACEENTENAYRLFINNHPNSPYIEEAKKLMEEKREQRFFDQSVKNHDMTLYLSSYPQGKMVREALEYKENFKKQNRKRMALTAAASFVVLLMLVVLLRDQYHTYSFISSILIKFLALEAVACTLIDMRRFPWAQAIFAPTLVFFIVLNFTPTVEIVSSNQQGNVRRALFHYIKDTQGNHIGVSGYSILNNTNKTLYLTHLEYIRNSRRLADFSEINPQCVRKISSCVEVGVDRPIDLYFKNPPATMNMDGWEKVKFGRSWRMREVHYEKRHLSVLDFQIHE